MSYIVLMDVDNMGMIVSADRQMDIWKTYGQRWDFFMLEIVPLTITKLYLQLCWMSDF